MKGKWFPVFAALLFCSCKKEVVVSTPDSPQTEVQKADVSNAPNTPAAKESATPDGANPRARPSLPPVERDYPKPPPPPEISYAKAIEGKPGYVMGPDSGKVIDVRNIPPGTLVADPTFPVEEKKYFRVPEPVPEPELVPEIPPQQN
jgi:hypothetical protein